MYRSYLNIYSARVINFFFPGKIQASKSRLQYPCSDLDILEYEILNSEYSDG
jgi:hypothetical protein